jgi:hypothetical protein
MEHLVKVKELEKIAPGLLGKPGVAFQEARRPPV